MELRLRRGMDASNRFVLEANNNITRAILWSCSSTMSDEGWLILSFKEYIATGKSDDFLSFVFPGRGRSTPKICR